MKLLLGVVVLVATLGVLYSAPEDQPTGISEDTLKRESKRKLKRHNLSKNVKHVINEPC